MKDFLEYEGYVNIIGSRTATREMFNKDLLENGQEWMNMIESRNETVHTYQEKILKEEFITIVTVYHPLFNSFYSTMKSFL